MQVKIDVEGVSFFAENGTVVPQRNCHEPPRLSDQRPNQSGCEMDQQWSLKSTAGGVRQSYWESDWTVRRGREQRTSLLQNATKTATKFRKRALQKRTSAVKTIGYVLTALDSAERGGFEPPYHFDMVTALAMPRNRPLCHLSEHSSQALSHILHLCSQGT